MAEEANRRKPARKQAEPAGSASTLRFAPRANRAAEINWSEWGSEPFARAAEEGKPVFLAISAVWCHWCHVMDETTYSDPRVIEILNRSYVPVRVDTDMRPDVNRRYNQGGWPSAAILTAEGFVLVGTTYLPPEDMRALLTRAADYCRENGERIAEEVREAIAADEQLRHRAAPTELGPEVRAGVLRGIERSADRRYGGLGLAPKFPQVDTVTLALDGFLDSGDPALLEYVEKSLHAFGDRGMYDHVEGGFFRYSVDREFATPHYEKMLEDNAKLVRVYLRTYGVTGDAYYRDKAAHTASYMAGTLSDGRSVFFGSQDADEEYYRLDAEGRATRPAPFVDRTVYTDLSALAASAFLHAGMVLVQENYLSLALSALDTLWECHAAGRGLCHYRTETEPELWGLLDDQVYTTEALLEAFSVTGDERHITRAVELVEEMIANHLDAAGGFFDLAGWLEELPGNLRFRAKELPANAQAARVLILLGELTGRTKYADLAEQALRQFGGVYREHGLFAATYASSVELLLRGPTDVLLTGSRDDVRTVEMARAAWSTGVPNLLINWIDPSRPAAPEHIVVGMPEMPERPTADLCKDRRCLAKVDEPGRLSVALKSLFRGAKEEDYVRGLS